MPENTSAAGKGKTYKIVIGIESAIIVILLVLYITSWNKANTFVIEKEKAVSERQVMQKQLDSLVREHEKIATEYGNMTKDLGRKDSLIQAQAGEIQKLIESNAGKRQIQRKLDYLRGITQDYVAQIDKLLKENENLKTEVKGMQVNIKEEQDKNSSLTKDKDALSEKITKAAVLAAYSMTATGIRTKQGGAKEEVVDKAKRVEKIKITFTLAKNPLVETGEKSIYVRIARPDNAIMNDGGSFLFEGKQIMYTLMKTYNYTGNSINVSLYYDKTDHLPAGAYNIAAFCDGKEIGQCGFSLK